MYAPPTEPEEHRRHGDERHDCNHRHHSPQDDGAGEGDREQGDHEDQTRDVGVAHRHAPGSVPFGIRRPRQDEAHQPDRPPVQEARVAVNHDLVGRFLLRRPVHVVNRNGRRSRGRGRSQRFGTHGRTPVEGMAIAARAGSGRGYGCDAYPSCMRTRCRRMMSHRFPDLVPQLLLVLLARHGALPSQTDARTRAISLGSPTFQASRTHASIRMR